MLCGRHPRCHSGILVKKEEEIQTVTAKLIYLLFTKLSPSVHNQTRLYRLGFSGYIRRKFQDDVEYQELTKAVDKDGFYVSDVFRNVDMTFFACALAKSLNILHFVPPAKFIDLILDPSLVVPVCP